jgi:hypothetical protein
VGGVDDRIFTNPTHADPAAKFSRAVFIARFIAGHLFAIPLGMIWAAGSIPLLIHKNIDELKRMEGQDEIIGNFIAMKTVWPGVAVFIALNLCAFVWAVAQKHPKSHYVFFGGFGVILVSGVLFGAASWIWLFMR